MQEHHVVIPLPLKCKQGACTDVSHVPRDGSKMCLHVSVCLKTVSGIKISFNMGGGQVRAREGRKGTRKRGRER
jgi:hypothetical protein